MAVEAFSKIEGEVLANGHTGTMVVLDWAWGLGQSGTLHTAPTGRSTAGKPNVDGRTIAEPLDNASPTLIRACAQARHLPEATLICRHSGGEPCPFWSMGFTEIMIRSTEFGSGEQPSDRPTETFALNFAQFKVTSLQQDGTGLQQDDAGQPQDKVKIGWSIQNNAKL